LNYENLHEFLKKEKYKKIKFKITKTAPLDKSKVNGVVGNFLDTGASNSCVGFESVLFQLEAEDSKTKASGAGATECKHKRPLTTLQLGLWKDMEFNLVILICLTSTKH
jgi:hypothetical protein